MYKIQKPIKGKNKKSNKPKPQNNLRGKSTGDVYYDEQMCEGYKIKGVNY